MKRPYFTVVTVFVLVMVLAFSQRADYFKEVSPALKAALARLIPQLARSSGSTSVAVDAPVPVFESTDASVGQADNQPEPALQDGRNKATADQVVKLAAAAEQSQRGLLYPETAESWQKDYQSKAFNRQAALYAGAEPAHQSQARRDSSRMPPYSSAAAPAAEGSVQPDDAVQPENSAPTAGGSATKMAASLIYGALAAPLADNTASDNASYQSAGLRWNGICYPPEWGHNMTPTAYSLYWTRSSNATPGTGWSAARLIKYPPNRQWTVFMPGYSADANATPDPAVWQPIYTGVPVPAGAVGMADVYPSELFQPQNLGMEQLEEVIPFSVCTYADGRQYGIVWPPFLVGPANMNGWISPGDVRIDWPSGNPPRLPVSWNATDCAVTYHLYVVGDKYSSLLALAQSSGTLRGAIDNAIADNSVLFYNAGNATSACPVVPVYDNYVIVLVVGVDQSGFEYWPTTAVGIIKGNAVTTPGGLINQGVDSEELSAMRQNWNKVVTHQSISCASPFSLDRPTVEQELDYNRNGVVDDLADLRRRMDNGVKR